MELTIWKFEIPALASFSKPVSIEMPAGSEILSVGEQRHGIFIWAEVNPTKPRVQRHFVVCPTGGELPPPKRTFLGTVFMGSLVFHIYEVLRGGR